MSIPRLLVIAGPKAVGKSFLIGRLQRQEVPHLAEALSFGDPLSWRYSAALEFESEDQRAPLRDAEVGPLLLHYEITRPWNRRYDYGFLQDKPLRLIAECRQVAFLTLWAPCDLLLSRFLVRNPRFQSPVARLRSVYYHGFRPRSLDADFRPLYRKPDRLLSVFERWFEFTHFFRSARHILVDSSDERFATIEATGTPEELLARIAPSLTEPGSRRRDLDGAPRGRWQWKGP